MRPSPDPLARAARRLSALGRPALLLAGMWAIGLIALSAVIAFENRVDRTRRAQVVIAQMHNQEGALLEIAFNPAIAPTPDIPRRDQTNLQLALAKSAYNASIARLAGFGNSDAPARIEAASARYFGLIDHFAAEVAAGRDGQAALELGRSKRPGGITATLDSELARADRSYGVDARRSRQVTAIATVIAIVFLLTACSIALLYSLRARRRSHHDASTDALTGLGNRRKLFADMEGSGTGKDAVLAVGMFDLDGFKAYNDTFGHPAGDALLKRLGSRLAGALDGRGNAYRTGGDEFVVITAAADGERLLRTAQTALSEQGADYAIGCSTGSARILAGGTLEQALHVADERLYADKRTAQKGFGTDAKDALLQVLAEQDEHPVTHLGHVAELAVATAIAMKLPPREIALTRLAAELHDVGKSAIPSAVIGKAGTLDAGERSLMQRNGGIGHRIVASAPALEAIGPIVRAVHERPDGTGHPDGLRLDEIPPGARIIAVVDAYDAMTNDRPSRGALPPAEAIAEIRRQAGAQFDPAVVEAFARVVTPRASEFQAA